MIEEKILELQAKKKELAKMVLDDASQAMNITKQDLLNLLD
jgi:SNF2 family DNA or RNA helicase